MALGATYFVSRRDHDLDHAMLKGRDAASEGSIICYGARNSGRRRPLQGPGGRHRASPIHRRRAASFVTSTAFAASGLYDIYKTLGVPRDPMGQNPDSQPESEPDLARLGLRVGRTQTDSTRARTRTKAGMDSDQADSAKTRTLSVLALIPKLPLAC